jgi:hypothetical protein
MANAWTQVDQIAAESLMQLEDALVITQLTARDKTADFNKTPDGYAVGDTVRIKTRPDFEAKEFAGSIEIQDVRESQRSMTIEKHFDVSVEITAKEKALDMDGFTEQVIKPAVIRLAEKADRYVGTKILEGAGTYASNDLFATGADMALARQAGMLQQLDPTGRYCLVNDSLEAKLLGQSYFTTYNSRGDAGESVFKEAAMGRAMGMNFFSSMNLPVDVLATAGTGTSQTDNGAGANNLIGVSTLTIDALTGQLEAGDRIEIAGMRRPLIVASQVLATATAVPLTDPISEIVPDNAALTVIGTGTTNLDFQGAIFDSQSLAVAMPVLDSPSDKPSFVISNNGYSIRVTQGYDMATKKETMSLDILMGAKAYDPRRITLLREY